jgi:transposase
MKLLPLSFTKDAARAVKRICKEAFTKVQDSVLTELLGVATLTVTMFCLRIEGELEVLPDRHKGTLEEWFDSLTEQQRKAIRFVYLNDFRTVREAGPLLKFC